MKQDRIDRSPLMGRALWFVAALLLPAVGPWPVMAQPAPQSRIDVSKLGPQVGQPVPEFSLKDQNGKTQTLHSIMGPKGAMLVFIRSANW